MPSALRVRFSLFPPMACRERASTTSHNPAGFGSDRRLTGEWALCKGQRIHRRGPLACRLAPRELPPAQWSLLSLGCDGFQGVCRLRPGRVRPDVPHSAYHNAAPPWAGCCRSHALAFTTTPPPNLHTTTRQAGLRLWQVRTTYAPGRPSHACLLALC